MSNCITREYLMQNVAACTPVEYEVPEWGGHVFIERTMTEKAAEYSARLDKLNDLSANVALIIAFCINEDGSPLFMEGDAEWLGKQPLSVTGPLAKKIAMLNGFSADIQEEAEKNFEKADS